METEKYSPHGPFKEPVLRCDACQKIVLLETLLRVGKCPLCGNRKVRALTTLSESEMDFCKKQGIDPEFLSLYEPVEVVEVEQ